MINITDLKKEDIGKWVLYTASHGATETGRLKSWNDKFVFVVYKCGNEWNRHKDFTGQATKPEDLRFMDSAEVLLEIND